MNTENSRPWLRSRYRSLSYDEHFLGHFMRPYQWEKNELERLGASAPELEAFDSAARSEHLYSLGYTDQSKVCAFQALSAYPHSVDGHRIISLLLTRPGLIVDSDTQIAVLRESLAFLRPSILANLLAPPSVRAADIRLRAVVRFLVAFASPLMMVDRPDTVIRALEEAVRVDHEDHAFAREHLLLCYLKMVGRRHRGERLPIERTVAHVQGLITCHFPESAYPLFDRVPSTSEWFNEDLMVLRWAEILLAFERGDAAWQTLLQEEDAICPSLIRRLLDGLIVRSGDPTGANDHAEGTGSRIAERLMICLCDWPDFMIAAQLLIRGAPNPALDARVTKLAPHSVEERSRSVKHTMSELSQQLLEKGRNNLTQGAYDAAIRALADARQLCAGAMRPSHRWYGNARFQIASNRALAAERLEFWNLCRHDTRFTLLMQSDHWKSYQRLPLIVENFGCQRLKSEMELFLSKLETHRPSSNGEWNQAAAKAISMLSITAIMEEMTQTLSPNRRNELRRIGIEDCYTPIQVGLDVMEQLPWLDDSELL
jgi:hypothetical protein